MFWSSKELVWLYASNETDLIVIVTFINILVDLPYSIQGEFLPITCISEVKKVEQLVKDRLVSGLIRDSILNI